MGEHTTLILGIAAFVLFVGGAVALGLRAVKALFKDVDIAMCEFRERTPIAQATEKSSVSIAGTIRHLGGPVTSPLSGTPCVAWKVTIEEVRSPNRGDAYWHPIDSRQSITSFVVEDDTGRARINAGEADTHIDSAKTVASWTTDTITDRVENFLQRQRVKRVDGWGGAMRVTEAILQEGHGVAVVGIGHWEQDRQSPGASFRDVVSKRLVVDRPAKARLFVKYLDPAGL